MSGRIRVVHVTTTDVSLDWLLRPQLEAFADAGYEVIGASAPGPHVRRLESSGIEHLPLRHATRAWAPGSDVMALAELVTQLRRVRPQIVHTHNPKPGLYGRLAARLARVPVVVNTVHGLYATPEDPMLKRQVVWGLERLATTWCDAQLVQNPEDVDTLVGLGIPADKVHLLGNGIDLARFDPERGSGTSRVRLRRQHGFDDDDVVVGLVGRLVHEKGYREAFDALGYLMARDRRIRAVVVGPMDPSKGDALSEEEISVQRARGIVFTGGIEDVVGWYEAMDVYVLASHREGFPRSAMEAAAMGLPVVATDIRGCRQVVDDTVNGYLVPPRDGVALADAVRSLVEDRSARLRMGEAGRVKARAQFDQQDVIDKTLLHYRRLLEARSL